MNLTKTHDLGQGWVARLYDTGDMSVAHDATQYNLTIPKKSVDTLIDICAQINSKQKDQNNAHTRANIKPDADDERYD